MSVNNKHLATILLGAAAAFGAYKYNKMTDEERQKMADSLKDKFHKLKGEAEGAAGHAKDYFSDLKGKVTDMFKEHCPGAEEHMEEFFNHGAGSDAAGTAATTPATPGMNPGA